MMSGRILGQIFLLLVFFGAVAVAVDHYRPDSSSQTAANPSARPGAAGPPGQSAGQRPQGQANQARGAPGNQARGGRPGGGPPGGRRSPPPLVEVAQTVTQEVKLSIEAVGTTRARRSVEIVPLAPGRVEQVHFEGGDRITEGQVLVTLEGTVEAAAVRNAKATLEEARRAMERAETLVARGSMAQSLLDERHAATLRAQATFDQASHALELRTIKAPFGGTIGFREIEPGARIDTSTVVARLDDLSEIELDFRLPESIYGQVATGLTGEARAAAYPDRMFTGEVTLISSRVDEASRSFRVRLAIPNEDHVLPAGMFMTVDLTLKSRAGVMVPEEAVVAEAGASHVFVVANGMVEKRPVEIGVRRDGLAEIMTGVADGETVVTRGVQKVRPGRPVRVAGEGQGGGTDGQTGIRPGGQRPAGQPAPATSRNGANQRPRGNRVAVRGQPTAE